MIACILYTGADNTGKTLAHDCPQHTVHRYGQHKKDIGTWLHAYCTLVRTAQERHWHMIARILYTGSDSTRYTLAHDCTHTLHRYAQHKKYIDTWLHAYSTQVRTAQKRHWHAVACILYIGPCHMIAHIVYTGEDITWKTLAPDCIHTLHKYRHHKEDIGTWLHAESTQVKTAHGKYYQITVCTLCVENSPVSGFYPEIIKDVKCWWQYPVSPAISPDCMLPGVRFVAIPMAKFWSILMKCYNIRLYHICSDFMLLNPCTLHHTFLQTLAPVLFADEVACEGCSNIAYPLLVLRIMPTGETSNSIYVWVQHCCSSYSFPLVLWARFQLILRNLDPWHHLIYSPEARCVCFLHNAHRKSVCHYWKVSWFEQDDDVGYWRMIFFVIFAKTPPIAKFMGPT